MVDVDEAEDETKVPELSIEEKAAIEAEAEALRRAKE